MWMGHALVIALGPPTGYRHFAQAPALEGAAALVAWALVATVAAALRHAFRGRQQSSADWALPAFAAVRALGVVRVTGAILLVQFVALGIGESLEQHAAGITLSGIAGLVGSTLAYAPAIYLAIGAAAGAVAWLAARAVCANCAFAVAVLRAAVAWLRRRTSSTLTRVHNRVFIPVGLPQQPLSFKLANRPPPASTRLA